MALRSFKFFFFWEGVGYLLIFFDISERWSFERFVNLGRSPSPPFVFWMRRFLPQIFFSSNVLNDGSAVGG